MGGACYRACEPEFGPQNPHKSLTEADASNLSPEELQTGVSIPEAHWQASLSSQGWLFIILEHTNEVRLMEILVLEEGPWFPLRCFQGCSVSFHPDARS